MASDLVVEAELHFPLDEGSKVLGKTPLFLRCLLGERIQVLPDVGEFEIIQIGFKWGFVHRA